MNSSIVELEEVLSSITSSTNDRDYKQGYSKSWYMARVRDAVHEMVIDTYAFKEPRFLPIPPDLKIELPSGLFNLKEVYLVNMDAAGCCLPGPGKRVLWKRLFDNARNANNYTAKISESDADAFAGNRLDMSSDDPGYFGNLYSNILILSPSCSSYSHVKIIANSFGSDDDSMPPIPRVIKNYVVFWVAEFFFRMKKVEDMRKYRPLWADTLDQLEKEKQVAKRRLKRSSQWNRESFSEYTSKYDQ